MACSLAITAQANSCDCLWQGSFNRAAKQADLVVSGTVIRHKGNSADLQVERILNGKEFRETIRLWGDNGRECRPPIDDFPVNSSWVLALHRIDHIAPGGFNPNTPNISYGRKDDYYISGCGAYWLKLNEGYVTGNLIKGPRWQWHNEKMSPVLLELIDAYLDDVLPDSALIEAAKPQTASKKLMNETLEFLRQQ